MNKLLLLIAVVSLSMGGCTDVLVQTNPNELAEGTFWQSPSDAHLALMGAYSSLQSPYLFDSDPWVGGMMRLDFISDNGYTLWQWMPWASISRAEFTSTSWGNAEFFRAAYDAITRSNRVIANIPQVEGMDQAMVNRMIAEAKVIRSTAYLLLAMTYGDVPLIDVPLLSEESDVPKSSKDEVFNFVFTDLSEAAGDLPVTVPGSEWGRITRGAALGMLARAHLYHGDYAKAASTAMQVMDLGVYSLHPDYSELFTPEHEMSDEVIFSVTFARTQGEGSSFSGYWGNDMIPYHIPLPDLAEAYYCIDGLPIDESPLYTPDHKSKNRDPRFEATIVANGDTWKGEPVSGQDIFHMRKWVEEENNLDHFDSPQDFYVLRYAHILLIRAEALVRVGKDYHEVYALINQIRDRVGMPHVEEVEGSGLPRQELLDVVQHERRVETAFEGLRYFDLKRWGEMEEAYQEHNNEAYGSYGPSMRQRVWEERYMKWPLPQAEVNANDELEQHPGY